MVALGACSITLGSMIAMGHDNPAKPRTPCFARYREFCSGMGFLGAGVILRGRDNDNVQGLATAAAIWIACILGVLAGLGEWLLGD